MNRRFVVTVIAATAFNIIITLLCFVFFTVIFSLVLAPRIPEEKAVIAFPVLFVLSLAASFFVYQWALRVYLKRILKHQ